VSFQLQINSRRRPQAISVSFGLQLIAPIILLVVIILGISILMDDESIADRSEYTVGMSIEPATISQLQRQLVDLDSESKRLTEFSKKMVTLAKLDKGIFEFDKPPARGGLGGRNIFQKFTSNMANSMTRDAEVLKKHLFEQSNQFERMQLVLRSRILDQSKKASAWPVSTAYISSGYGVRKDP